MERCLDCNSVLMTKEKMCPTCGAKVGLGALSPAELFARAGTVAFYGAVLAFLVSRFTPNGTSFSMVLSICAAVVMFLMRKKIFAR